MQNTITTPTISSARGHESARLDMAIKLASKGYHIFPLAPGSKKPAIPKCVEADALGLTGAELEAHAAECGNYGHGVYDATIDTARIEAWWAEDDYNLGVRTGRVSNLAVIDIDDADYEKALADAGLSDLPPTAEVVTPHGLHQWYQFPENKELRNTARKLGPKIDTRGANGYVLGPGSTVEGVTYKGTPRSLVPLPEHVLKLLERPSKPSPEAVYPRLYEEATLGTPYALAVLHGEASELAAMLPDSGRNDKLNRAVWKCYQYVAGGALDAENVDSALTEAAQKCGLEPGEIPATLASGRAAGLKDPLTGPLPELASDGAEADPQRRVRFTLASDIKARPTHWAWEARIPAGELTLLAGREGLGKSTAAFQLAADLTRGALQGEHFGTPKSVIISAAEDSWDRTIVPRLKAAGADLSRVARVDALIAEGVYGEISLPVDIQEMKAYAEESDAAMIIVDPLITHLGDGLDSHKYSDMSKALKKMTALAHATRASVLGIIHLNKGGSSDPLNAVMGSKAFTGVARSVLLVAPDPDDEAVALLGQIKNNLGPKYPRTMPFAIEDHLVEEAEEGPVRTGRLRWLDEQDRSIREVYDASLATREEKTVIQEATDWVADLLTAEGRPVSAADIKDRAKAAGYAQRTVERAKNKLKLEVLPSETDKRIKLWALPGQTAEASSGQPLPF